MHPDAPGYLEGSGIQIKKTFPDFRGPGSQTFEMPDPGPGGVYRQAEKADGEAAQRNHREKKENGHLPGIAGARQKTQQDKQQGHAGKQGDEQTGPAFCQISAEGQFSGGTE